MLPLLLSRSLRKKKRDDERAGPATPARANTVPSRPTPAPATLPQRDRDKEMAGLAALERSRTLPREYLPGIYGVPSQNATQWIATGNSMGGTMGGPVAGQLVGAPIPPFRPAYRPLPYEKPPKLRDHGYTRSWVRVPGPAEGTRVLLQDAPVLGTNYNVTVHIDGSAPPQAYTTAGYSDVFPDGRQEYKYPQQPLYQPVPPGPPPLTPADVAARTLRDFGDEQSYESGPVPPYSTMPATLRPVHVRPDISQTLSSEYRRQQSPHMVRFLPKSPIPASAALRVAEQYGGRETYGSRSNKLRFSTADSYVYQYHDPSGQHPPMARVPERNVHSSPATPSNLWPPQLSPTPVGRYGSSSSNLTQPDSGRYGHSLQLGPASPQDPVRRSGVSQTSREHVTEEMSGFPSARLRLSTPNEQDYQYDPSCSMYQARVFMSDIDPTEIPTFPGNVHDHHARLSSDYDSAPPMTSQARPDRNGYQYLSGCTLAEQREYTQSSATARQSDVPGYGHVSESESLNDMRRQPTSDAHVSRSLTDHEDGEQQPHQTSGSSTRFPIYIAPRSTTQSAAPRPGDPGYVMTEDLTFPPSSHQEIIEARKKRFKGKVPAEFQTPELVRVPMNPRPVPDEPGPLERGMAQLSDSVVSHLSDLINYEDVQGHHRSPVVIVDTPVEERRSEATATNLELGPEKPGRVPRRERSQFSERVSSPLSEVISYEGVHAVPQRPVVAVNTAAEERGSETILMNPKLVSDKPGFPRGERSPFFERSSSHMSEVINYEDEQADPRSPVIAVNIPTVEEDSSDTIMPHIILKDGHGLESPADERNDASDGWRTSLESNVDGAIGDVYIELPPSVSKPRRGFFGLGKKKTAKAEKPVSPFTRSRTSSLNVAPGTIIVNTENNSTSNIRPPIQQSIELVDMSGYTRKRDAMPTAPDRVLRRGAVSHEHGRASFQAGRILREDVALPIATEALRPEARRQEAYSDGSFDYDHTLGHSYESGFGTSYSGYLHPGGGPAFTDPKTQLYGTPDGKFHVPPSQLHYETRPATTDPGAQVYGAPDGQFHVPSPYVSFATRPEVTDPGGQLYGAPDGQFHAQGQVLGSQNHDSQRSIGPGANERGTIHQPWADFYALPYGSKVEAFNPIQELNRLHSTNPADPVTTTVALPSNVALLGADGRPTFEIYNGGAVGTANGPPLRVMELPDGFNVEYFEQKIEAARLRRKVHIRRLIICSIALLMVPLPLVIYSFVFNRPDLDSL